jgi:hypothetical protein
MVTIQKIKVELKFGKILNFLITGCLGLSALNEGHANLENSNLTLVAI